MPEKEAKIDIFELSREIREKRGKTGLRETANQIGGVSASTLSRVEQGKIPDLDTFVRICKWLGISSERFTGTRIISSETTKDIIVANLRADRVLDKDTADALVVLIQKAYEGVDKGKIGHKKGNNASRIQKPI